MVAIVLPSGANAKARMAVFPTPRAPLDRAASLRGLEIGSQGRTMSAGRSRAIHLQLHHGNRAIPTRHLIGPSPAAQGMGPWPAVAPRMGSLSRSKGARA